MENIKLLNISLEDLKESKKFSSVFHSIFFHRNNIEIKIKTKIQEYFLKKFLNFKILNIFKNKKSLSQLF